MSFRALDYFKMAESYAVAVKSLAPHVEDARAPFHMLVGHTLELSLKAVLLHRGDHEEELMLVGHDLHFCHEEARMQGWKGAGDITVLVDRLEGPHRDQRFRYPGFRGGFLDLPALEIAARLQRHLRNVRAFLDDG